jgi:hypothetical protein
MWRQNSYFIIEIQNNLYVYSEITRPFRVCLNYWYCYFFKLLFIYIYIYIYTRGVPWGEFTCIRWEQKSSLPYLYLRKVSIFSTYKPQEKPNQIKQTSLKNENPNHNIDLNNIRIIEDGVCGSCVLNNWWRFNGGDIVCSQ